MNRIQELERFIDLKISDFDHRINALIKRNEELSAERNKLINALEQISRLNIRVDILSQQVKMLEAAQTMTGDISRPGDAYFNKTKVGD